MEKSSHNLQMTRTLHDCHLRLNADTARVSRLPEMLTTLFQVHTDDIFPGVDIICRWMLVNPSFRLNRGDVLPVLATRT